MDQKSWLTERFEENRPRLRGVAYRVLGSLSEAEDAVQERDSTTDKLADVNLQGEETARDAAQYGVRACSPKTEGPPHLSGS